MCGIAGFVHWEGHRRDDASARVKAMADQLAHRGPDADGYFVDRFCALGHRRLSIIDLAGGKQPMSTADGMLTITFNGEIYNYRDLRGDLEKRGHVFTTQSDTEVLLLGFREWGPMLMTKLNGMFAFAIWDAGKRQLFVARDRVGKKPVYLATNRDGMAFASEIKGLIAGGFVGGQLDPCAVDSYFSFGYVPGPRSIYQDVCKLPPAHYLIIDADDEQLVEYWRLEPNQVADGKASDLLEELEGLLDDAVKIRMISDVPLGAFLSGGIDSALIVSSMAKATTAPVLTHCIGFEDERYDETAAARAVAQHFRTDHYETVIRPSAADTLEDIAWHLDEPLGDSSALPTWHVCKATRSHVKVALSGDGGDEAFGGYTFRYLPHLLEARIRNALPQPFRAAIFGPLGSVWPRWAGMPKPLRLKTIFENLSTSNSEAYYRDLLHLRQDERQSLYASFFDYELRGFSPRETTEPLYSRSSGMSALGRARLADIAHYMVDDVLTKVDRMSMAHSLEVRSPLLDYRILELASKLDDADLIDRREGKKPLRELARRRIPKQNAMLPKRGFSVPVGDWLRGELRPMVEATVFSPNGAVRDFLELEPLRKMWSDHLRGTTDSSSFIWQVLTFSVWADRWRDARASRQAA